MSLAQRHRSNSSGSAGESCAWAVAVTAVAALLSHVTPEPYAATAVAACFGGASYWLVLRREAFVIEHFGCALGGLLSPVPLRARQVLRRGWRALCWCAAAMAITFPAFWVGYVEYWRPNAAFSWPAPPPVDAWLGHFFAVAIPEELFYRGYAQTALDRASRQRVRVLGAELGVGLLASSVIFALGHVATQPYPGRLMVFFPSLAFGWLRARTGGIGASALYHAACNLFAAYLGEGYYGS